MGFGDLKYEIECPVCGRRFRVPEVTSNVPKHPPKGEKHEPGLDYIPCVGSGAAGIPIRQVIEGAD
jgi:hypothetical protein